MKRVYVIRNKEGLHARPATMLVHKANEFQSKITITHEGVSTDLKSIMSVLSLGVNQGALIEIEAEGVDEVPAIREITQLINKLSTK
ncbi:MAG: HPr family phosphocarrier protein [Candidatus Izemoplasma sp.]|nr:HPr family phosphocarrier protein [Candidatus Izemoplasma sp.]